MLRACQLAVAQSLDLAGVLLLDDVLSEAEETCRLLAALSTYQREWRLHLPNSLQTLMVRAAVYIDKWFHNRLHSFASGHTFLTGD